MRRLGLVGVRPKKRKMTTILDRADAYHVDIVQRKWVADTLSQMWVGDISYLCT